MRTSIIALAMAASALGGCTFKSTTVERAQTPAHTIVEPAPAPVVVYQEPPPVVYQAPPTVVYQAQAPAVYTPPPDTTTATSALTAADGQYWRDWGCFVHGAGYADVAGCYPNWANGGYGQANTRTSFFVVAPFAGDAVSVRTQYQGKTQFQDPAFVGEWDGWWYHSSINTSRVTGPEYNIKTHRWDILQATGDQFHWSVAFKWNCSGTWACDQWPVRD